MTIRVLKPGLQTTIQAAPRIGLRHLGVPASGAADPLSMALANRLVGNEPLAPALEVTLTGMAFEVLTDVSLSITGATANCTINGQPVRQHETLNVDAGDQVVIGAAEQGARSYVAFAGGLIADDVLGSRSTYLPAGLGGLEGRELQTDDKVKLAEPTRLVSPVRAPEEFMPPMLVSWTLRAGRSGETNLLHHPEKLYDRRFEVGGRSDRMGIKLEAQKFAIRSKGRMPSAPVFPGIVQCPEDGELFILSVDAQTTGGYPRVAKIIRADLHLLGQLRPGNRLTLIERTDEAANDELEQKHAYWKAWLPDVAEII